MVDASLLLFHFSLGALAFFSPCGFPMLPAYLAYYLPRGEGREGDRFPALARGLAGGLFAALGAIAVLGAIAALALLLGSPFKQRVFWLELVGGLVVLTLGVLTLAGRAPTFRLGLRPSKRRDALGLVGFGALYAGVAASCVAPLFIGVLVVALNAPTALDTALLVGAYGAGLASLLIAVTVLVALSQHAAMARLRRVLPHVERISGVVLVLVGLYLLTYWANAEFALGIPLP